MRRSRDKVRPSSGTGAPAPLLGEHTDELLAEVGLSTADIAALHDAGVVA